MKHKVYLVAVSFEVKVEEPDEEHAKWKVMKFLEKNPEEFFVLASLIETFDDLITKEG